MRPTLPCVLVPICVLSPMAGCHSSVRQTDQHTMAPTTTKGEIAGRSTLAMPISIPGQSVVLVPFAIETEKDWFQSDDPFAKQRYMASASPASIAPRPAYYASSLGGSVRWHNAIFREIGGTEQWPLLDRRGVVSAWNCFGLEPQKDERFIARHLVFLVTSDDTNKDGVLNDRDARVAMVTKASGRESRRVTPADAQVWSVNYDPAFDTMYFQVVADTNRDGKFTFEDQPMPYVLEPNASVAQPALSEEMMRRVEGLVK